MAQIFDIRFPDANIMLPLKYTNNNIFSTAQTLELDRGENQDNNSRVWELEDLLPMYPDQNVPNIQTYVTAKEEFIEKSAQIEESLPEQGNFLSYQELFQRYLHHYDRIVNIQQTGTGKTGAAGGAILEFRRNRKINDIFGFIDMYSNKNRSNIKKCIILVPNKLLRNEFRNQLIYKYTKPGEFDLDALNLKHGRSRSKALSGMISDFVTIMTYRNFSSKISAMAENIEDAREEIIKLYSDTLFINDEIHNIRIESGEGIKETAKKGGKRRQAITYENIHYVYHVIERSKIVLMSATLAINNAAEVADIFNLVLSLDHQLPTDREEFKEMSIDDLEPYYRGKISYIRQSGTFLVQKQMGEYLTGAEPGSKFTYNINGKEYITSTKIYIIPMITSVTDENDQILDRITQGKIYLEHTKSNNLKIHISDIAEDDRVNAAIAEEENEDTTDNVEVTDSRNNNFFKQTGKLKQISNGIFPDGSYGKEGFEKYINFDENLKDYVGTVELIEAIRDINDLRILSSKYAEIIEILKYSNDILPGPCYGYTHLKLGSGAYYLGICLEQHGFEKYRGFSYPFKNNPKNIPFNPACSPSVEDNQCGINDLLMLEKLTEIDETFPKKLRYAILTSNITDTEIFNIMELYNSPHNINGEYLKFLIITPFGKEGINLANSTKFILIDPGWNPSSEVQAKNRGIREASHIFKSAQLREMFPNDQKIKLEMETYNMCSYIENESASWEFNLYTLSESKDIEIKINERYMKIIAFDKELHKARNERLSDQNKNGTEECDYSLCTYSMYDPLPPNGYVDYSTYDLLYSDKVTMLIIQKIKEIFRTVYVITLNTLYRLLNNYRKKLVLLSLQKIINSKIPMINRMGNISYLYEDGENLFIHTEFPTSSTHIIKNTYNLNYYNQYITAVDILNIDDYISDEQITIQDKIISLMFNNTTSENPQELFEGLSIANKIKIFEDIIININNEMPMTADTEYIINKYSKSFFTEKEPIRDIAISSQELTSPTSGSKKKKVHIYNELNMDNLSPYKTTTDVSNRIGEDVIIHILYGDLQIRSSIAVSPAFKNAEGRIRIFKKSVGLWRDANDYESPVYRNIIIERRKDELESFKEKGLYGTIIGGKFRVVYNPNKTQHMDGRKAKKGAILTDMHKKDLFEIMYALQISLNLSPKTNNFSISDAVLLLNKNSIDTSKFSDDQIVYYYSLLMSKTTRKDLCDLIYENMDSKGLIYRT